MAQPASKEDIDLASLNKSKLKEMMRQDPRFIARLINQLDASADAVIKTKHSKLEQIKVDQARVDKLDEQIRTHIQPNLDRLRACVRDKTALKEHLALQIETEFGNLRKLEQDARSLIQQAKQKTGGLMRLTAAQRLEEARGFNTTTPTATLARGRAAKDPVPPS